MKTADKKENSLISTIFGIIKLDISVIITTYTIVLVYCYICVTSSQSELDASSKIQLFADALVPTTITIVLASIVQGFFINRKNPKNFFHVASLISVIVFTMFTSAFYPINSKTHLFRAVISIIIINILDLGMVFEQKANSHIKLGISGKE